jgi:hypothetical protein
VNAWIAKDRTSIGGVFNVCIFRKKPVISNAGFWTLADGCGRWPVDLRIKINEGDCKFIKIIESSLKKLERKSKTIEDFQRNSFKRAFNQ